MKNRVIFVRATEHLHEALRRAAKRERLSVSRFAAVVLRRYLAADTAGARDLSELERGNSSQPNKC